MEAKRAVFIILKIILVLIVVLIVAFLAIYRTRLQTAGSVEIHMIHKVFALCAGEIALVLHGKPEHLMSRFFKQVSEREIIRLRSAIFIMELVDQEYFQRFPPLWDPAPTVGKRRRSRCVYASFESIFWMFVFKSHRTYE